MCPTELSFFTRNDFKLGNMFRKAANHSTGYLNESEEGATMVGLVSTSNIFKEPLFSTMYDDVYQGQDLIYRGIPEYL